MITKKEVQHIAKLARLGITKKEEKRFAKELSSILDYVQKLKEAKISKVKPCSHPHLLKNVMREDYPSTAPHLPPSHPKIEKTKKLLEMAPEKKKGYLKVKAIL